MIARPGPNVPDRAYALWVSFLLHMKNEKNRD